MAYATRFRHPLGDGRSTIGSDGDGFYVAFGFNQPNDEIGGSRHLGVDWNGEIPPAGDGNSDLGQPVHAIANGNVVEQATNQDSATSGFGNYVVIRHQLLIPIAVNGQTVHHVHSLYAHLDDVVGLSVGQQVSIGQQIGALGSIGASLLAQLHLEITLGDVLPTQDDGYHPFGAPADWVDPVQFINSFQPQDNGLGQLLNMRRSLVPQSETAPTSTTCPPCRIAA